MSHQINRPLPRLAPLAAAAFTLLAMVGLPGPARSAPPTSPFSAGASPEDETSLLVARDRSARADAAVDALKRSLTAGHLTDPTPEADRAYGLETLRGELADLQAKAAGYRATLGERHPTLLGTEEVLAEARSHLQDATRRALASAQREAAEARAAADGLDRRLAAAVKPPSISAADATGSVAPAQAPETARAPRPHATTRSTALSAPSLDDASSASAAAPRAAGLDRPTTHRPWRLLTGVAAGALVLLLAVGAAMRLLRAIRTRARRPIPRVEPAIMAAAATSVMPSTTPAQVRFPAPCRPVERATDTQDAVPVLAILPLPGSNAAAHIATLFAREPDGALAGAAAALHATLRDAAPGEPGSRLTVLMTGADGLDESDGDLAALALALAAAAAGQRAVIMEARTAGRLRRTLVPAGTAPILVEAGGTERTLYRVDAGDLTVAVLPTDPGEAEAATAAGARPHTGRFRGLEAFDMVVLVGDHAETLARAADVVVIAASAAVTPESISAAARPCRAAGRVCGALVLARAATAEVVTMRPAPRRRVTPDPIQMAPARLGLRGSIAPSRRHAAR